MILKLMSFKKIVSIQKIALFGIYIRYNLQLTKHVASHLASLRARIAIPVSFSAVCNAFAFLLYIIW